MCIYIYIYIYIHIHNKGMRIDICQHKFAPGLQPGLRVPLHAAGAVPAVPRRWIARRCILL